MEKPITIRREELGQAVTEAINKSELPAFIIADLLDGMVRTMRKLEAQQARVDRELWEAEQKKADTEKPKKKEKGKEQ